MSTNPSRDARENRASQPSSTASIFLLKTYEALGRIVGRLSKRYYFEDFVRVYPDGLAFFPLGLRRTATRNTINNYLNHVKFYQFAAQFVPRRVVADVGCGSGYGSDLLAKAGAAQVCGSDASRRAIAFALSRYRASAEFSVQGITGLWRYADNSFDVSIANEVLEHVKEYGKEEDAIAEMRRITRSGGLLVIGTPNGEMMPDHGFSFEEIRSLFQRNFRRYCIFENALVPPGEARSLWEKRKAEGRVGTIISERIDLSETVWLDRETPEIKVGITPGPSEFAGYQVNTALLHNTHSWVVLALNEKVAVGTDDPPS